MHVVLKQRLACQHLLMFSAIFSSDSLMRITYGEHALCDLFYFMIFFSLAVFYHKKAFRF